MGVWVTVRGWLECDRVQLDAIARRVAGGPPPAYSGGWTFPARQSAWSCAAYFGADLRAQCVGELLAEVRALARTPASDADGDLVRGLFTAVHETDGVQEWRVRDGGVEVHDATDRYGYLNA
ncbi:hypothetical protein BIV57_00060 [Mangrovactinospora gilvigrisea]|uniref:Uncharacterized protein n=1 Tax=Mangrovactinospora gilvigrisea TaxID=1428644 RepID=A0A1J7BLG9_9ACTN|nr:hypothetical protein [Mangrovactinospora gilvigrisea]OIV39543.1 hypothetical protein BIV57_00060 [Mangrovactinospora gilvigrisea]